MLEAGTNVRVKSDPSKMGVATGETEDLNGRIYHTVRLNTGQNRKFLEISLEPVLEAPDALRDLANHQFSDISDLAHILTHVRLTGRLADIIYSMETTNTEFHAYQFKPVIKILNSAAKGLLIADEVGLGKTIEAGLVWTELVARYDMRRLLVVCPKSLQEKWRQELRSKFNIRANIVDAAELLQTLSENRASNDDFALIVSLSGVRQPKGWDDPAEIRPTARARLARYLEDNAAEGPFFDLVIFDEAHHLRNPETAQHKSARQIVDLADYKLMLTATPINLRSEDLRAVLKLVEPDLFDREWVFDELQRENEPVVAARECVLDPASSREDILAALANIQPGSFLTTEARLSILRERVGREYSVDTLSARIDIASRLEEMSMLGGVVNRTRRRDVSEIQVKRRATCRRWQMTEVEQEFYTNVSNAITSYAWTRGISEGFLLSNCQRLLASCLPDAYRRWASASDNFEREGDDDDEPQDATQPGNLVAHISQVCGNPNGFATLRANDSKYAVLVSALKGNWKVDASEKIIVFSSFRGTLDYIEERLREEGVQTFKMHGSVKTDRNDLLNAFREAATPCVLLTSEIGGEGLDMQFCRTLINYDLPWNPMKVEQRIGRIDRIGQTSPSIEVFSLICQGTIEDRVYERLYERLNLIERTLGGFEPKRISTK